VWGSAISDNQARAGAFPQEEVMARYRDYIIHHETCPLESTCEIHNRALARPGARHIRNVERQVTISGESIPIPWLPKPRKSRPKPKGKDKPNNQKAAPERKQGSLF
jgi:hypothetical protein